MRSTPRPPSSQQTLGPFFPRTFFRDSDSDMTRVTADAAPTARGETILLRGRVTRDGGVPCLNMILEAWQADAGGRFNHPLDPEGHLADPDFLGWGRAWTDERGCFAFRTVRPGGYADGSARRAPHINLTAMGAGLMRRVLTTVYFPESAEDNAVDPVLALMPVHQRGRLIAQRDIAEDGLHVYEFNIRLRGSSDEETPFFEE